jgi:hypothetical protein
VEHTLRNVHINDVLERVNRNVKKERPRREDLLGEALIHAEYDSMDPAEKYQDFVMTIFVTISEWNRSTKVKVQQNNKIIGENLTKYDRLIRDLRVQ